MIAWKRWTSYPTVRLWEAVALLLDIDPESLRGSSDNYLPGIASGPWFERSSFPSHKKYTDFLDAMSIAKRAATRDGPIYLRKGGSDGNAEVSLAEVAAYFVFCEWPDIPTRLMQLAGSIASTAEAPKPEQPQGKPVPRWTWQEEEILRTLRELGFNPQSLPKPEARKPGPKAAAKAALGSSGLWSGQTVFDKAWDRLRKEVRIADKR